MMVIANMTGDIEFPLIGTVDDSPRTDTRPAETEMRMDGKCNSQSFIACRWIADNLYCRCSTIISTRSMSKSSFFLRRRKYFHSSSLEGTLFALNSTEASVCDSWVEDDIIVTVISSRFLSLSFQLWFRYFVNEIVLLFLSLVLSSFLFYELTR